MYIIGIDCGVRTGFAVWDSDKQQLIAARTYKIHQAIDTVKDLRKRHDIKVIVEDARQRKWIPRERTFGELKGRAQGAGSVKRDASIWEDLLEDYGIPYEMQPPKRGLTKWTADEFKAVTGWRERTSEHARDAALLVIGRHDRL